MASPEEIAHQQNLLAIHRRNLGHYLGQQARLGPALTPIGTLNGIEEERANIKRIKGILRGWSQIVDNHPDDEPPPAPPTTTSSGQGATTQVGRDQIDARESQGYIGQAGTVSQNFGEQQNVNAGTVIYIQGGDFRGTNLPIGNTVGRDLNQSGGTTTMSAFDQRGWSVQGNVYNIAGDLNMSPNPGKDELLAALRQLRDELAKAQDLPGDKADEIREDLDSAVRAIDKPQPNKQRAVERLATIQKVLDGLKDNVGSALALGTLIGQVIQAAQNIRF